MLGSSEKRCGSVLPQNNGDQSENKKKNTLLLQSSRKAIPLARPANITSRLDAKGRVRQSTPGEGRVSCHKPSEIQYSKLTCLTPYSLPHPFCRNGTTCIVCLSLKHSTYTAYVLTFSTQHRSVPGMLFFPHRHGDYGAVDIAGKKSMRQVAVVSTG